MDNSPRTAIVTGGASGIGRGIARRLAADGYAVVIGDVRECPKQGRHHETDGTVPTYEAIRADGGRAHFQKTDVSDPEQCRALVKSAVEEFGSLDVLVNNAGIQRAEGVEEVTIDDWHHVLDVNLSGPFYCSKYALAHLRQTAGSIVNVASVNAVDGGSGAAYAASKAGLVNLTRDVAVSAGDDGVTANAVCPGYVKTPLQDYLSASDINASREQTLLGRLGEPRDIAAMISFLVSADADWITGETFFVDGGLMAHH